MRARAGRKTRLARKVKGRTVAERLTDRQEGHLSAARLPAALRLCLHKDNQSAIRIKNREHGAVFLGRQVQRLKLRSGSAEVGDGEKQLKRRARPLLNNLNKLARLAGKIEPDLPHLQCIALYKP